MARNKGWEDWRRPLKRRPWESALDKEGSNEATVGMVAWSKLWVRENSFYQVVG